MVTTTFDVTRRPEMFVSDDRRVITRHLDFGDPVRIRSILSRLLNLTEQQVRDGLTNTIHEFANRHRDLHAVMVHHYHAVAPHLPPRIQLSEPHRLLIGAYFTMEYAIESAALFNPSIVPHPSQGQINHGCTRFLMSLRATGEGHVSSIVFHRGVIDETGGITFDPPPRYAYSARPSPDKLHHKQRFFRRLIEMGVSSDLCRLVMEDLPEPFTLRQLQTAINQHRDQPDLPHEFPTATNDMLWLARANYELIFPDDCMPREIVIFPGTDVESRGMEDLRLVRFIDDDGKDHYYGTYTAYDGFRMLPMMLETADFTHFHISTLGGKYIRNKGLALFPRKVGGRYMMVSRHDGEKLYLLESDDMYTWPQAQLLLEPTEPWELTQIGNAGSPIETDAGWLLITHGVGPMRRYCLGAALLDLNEPWRVIGRLRDPLLEPISSEREGYVPNVVYSCGSMLHNGDLIVPYAISDVATKFATVKLDALLSKLLAAGP